MTSSAFIQVLLYLGVLFMLAYPLAGFMVKRMQAPLSANEQRWFSLFGMLGVDNHGKLSGEMNWKQYAIAILLFNIIGLVALFGLQLLQGILPLNPEKFSAPTWHSAFNTAVSFMTNTNWQSYGGESTMSYLTQMLGMSLQNFLSGATGIAVAFALIRGLTRKNAQGIGNAWVDLWRSNLYILLPIAIVITLLLVSQGVIQTLSSTVSVSTLQGAVQNIALGPVASQEAIKMLGTNGGGFFNANSAHPFENPTALSNFI